MAVDEIITFLRERISQGYSLDGLRKYLVQQGVPPGDISAALNAVKAETPRKSSRGKIIALCLFVLGTLLAVTGTMMYFSSDDAGPRNVKLSTALLTTAYEAGTPLELSIHLSGEGLRTPEAVLMTYSVMDRKRDRILFYKSETLSLLEDRYEQREIALPLDAAPGEFVLKTKATVYGESFISSFDFSIEETDEPVRQDDNKEGMERKQGFKVVKTPELVFTETAPASLPSGRAFPNMEVLRLDS